MKFFLITIVTILLAGCGGGGYNHTKFVKATVEIMEISEINNTIPGIIHPNEGLISGLKEEDKKIVIEVKFESILNPVKSFSPLIDKCGNGYPNTYEEIRERGIDVHEYSALEFENNQGLNVGYLFFSAKQLVDRGLIEEDGTIEDDICLFSSVNVLRNNMEQDDVAVIGKEDMQTVYFDYVHSQE